MLVGDGIGYYCWLPPKQFDNGNNDESDQDCPVLGYGVL